MYPTLLIQLNICIFSTHIINLSVGVGAGGADDGEGDGAGLLSLSLSGLVVESGCGLEGGGLSCLTGGCLVGSSWRGMV